MKIHRPKLLPGDLPARWSIRRNEKKCGGIMSKGFGWKKPEVVVAIMSSLIAVCAMYVAYNEGRATRLHNRLSVKPLITISQESGANNTKLSMENVGLGPAIIDKIAVTYRQKTVQMSAKDFTRIFDEAGVAGEYSLHVREGDYATIKPDKETVLFQIKYDPKYRDKVEKIFSDIESTIYYRSIYGETGVASVKGSS